MDDALLPTIEVVKPRAIPAWRLRTVPGVAERYLLPLEAGYIAVIHDGFPGRYLVRDGDAGTGDGGHYFDVLEGP